MGNTVVAGQASPKGRVIVVAQFSAPGSLDYVMGARKVVIAAGNTDSIPEV
jgi:hypothetical protein